MGILGKGGQIIGFGGGAVQYPKRGRMWHDSSLVLAGNPLARTINTNQCYATYSAQTAGALHDKFTNGIYLAPGNFTFRIVGVTASGHGGLTWDVWDPGANAFWINAFNDDWYSGGNVFNVVKDHVLGQTGGGWVIFRGHVDGKNPSSSGYLIRLTYFEVIPTSDT
jgi:hypothetical protein